MKCTNPIWLEKQGLEVPCGKCILCRIRKRHEWTTRVYHELNDWHDSCFITLTYDDYHLPHYLGDCLYPPTLRKRDLVLFLKRLRKTLDRRIKYFCCGEYGAETQRPHYHLILFGVSDRDRDREAVMSCWQKCDWKVQENKSFGTVEFESIRYTAKYIFKQTSGKMRDLEEEFRERQFVIMSKGLGKNWALRNREQIISNKSISVRGVMQSVPRYYLKVLGLTAEELGCDYAELKERDKYQKELGLAHTFDEFYEIGDKDIILKIDAERKKENSQHSKNKQAVVDRYRDSLRS